MIYVLIAIALLLIVAVLFIYWKFNDIFCRDNSFVNRSIADARNDMERDYLKEYYASVEQLKARKVEILTIESLDGYKLKGYLYRTSPSNNKIILAVHGYHSGGVKDMGRYIGLYESLGYDYLIMSQRCHEESEGRYISFGVNEHKDGLLWVNKILEMYGEDVNIVLHGVSMGGATVLMMSGSPDLPKQVNCVISDCSYDSFARQVDHMNERFPEWFQNIVIPFMNNRAKKKIGFEFKDAAPVDMVPDSMIPCLFIHGDQDKYVPCEMMMNLCRAYGGPKDFLIVKGAPHAYSFTVNTDAYTQKFCRFVSANGERKGN